MGNPLSRAYKKAEKSVKKNVSVKSIQDKAPKIGGYIGEVKAKTSLPHVGRGLETAVYGTPDKGVGHDYQSAEEADDAMSEHLSGVRDQEQEAQAFRNKLMMEREARMDAARVDQQRLGETLKARMEGTAGPSAAESQLQLATDRNMRGALAMAASGRGNAALANQAAGAQRAQMGQEAAAQATSLRAQEQQAATNQYQSLISDARNAELGIESAMARREGQRLGVESQERALDAQDMANRQAAREANQRAWTQAGIDVTTAVVTSGASAPGSKTAQSGPPEVYESAPYADSGGPAGNATTAPLSLTGGPTMASPEQMQAMQMGGQFQGQPQTGYAPPPMGGMGGFGGMGGYQPPPPGMGGFTGSPEQMAYQGPQDDQARRHQQMMAMVNASRMGRF